MDQIKMYRHIKPLDRGDLRLLVLALLKNPMHGYQIICQLRGQSKGGYNPSTGALYPQLRGLEEDGLIVCNGENGRKIYKITKSGEEYLQKNKKLVDGAMKRFADFWKNNDVDTLIKSITNISKTLMDCAVVSLESGDASAHKKLNETKTVLVRAEKEIVDIWN